MTDCWKVGLFFPGVLTRILVCIFAALLAACGSSGGTNVLPDGRAADAAADLDRGDRGRGDSSGDGPAAETPEGDGCIPHVCEDWGHECGDWGDGCGGEMHCGACPDGLFCDGGACADQPECGTAAQISQLDIGGGGNTATATAGQRVPFVFRWELGNHPLCADCTRQVVLGLGSEPAACVDAGTPPVCPDTTGGYDLGYFDSPAEPGVYDVTALATAELWCADAAAEFADTLDKQIVGQLEVLPACLAPGCASLGVECGLREDGCGGTLFCGECDGTDWCTPDGKCAPAAACAQDVFAITNAYVGGFAAKTTVAPKEVVPVLLSWQIGNSTSNLGKDRQVVVGVEKTPGFCIDVGEPSDCPAFDNGLGNGEVVAPGTAGVYTIYAAALSLDGCHDLTPAAFVLAPHLPLGALTVEGDCQSADCEAQAKSCGFQPDGCGGMPFCGACTGNSVCGENGKCGAPDCMDGIFDMTAAKMSLSGNVAQVLPGEKIPVVLEWRAGNSQDCPHCDRQVVVLAGGDPAFCLETGIPPVCPEWTYSAGAGFLDAPAAAGQTTVTAVSLAAGSCDQALLQAGASPLQVPIGVVVVAEDCAAATCTSLGRECGDWGDGCGGVVHCGDCLGAKVCNPKGQCEGECADGIFEVTSVGINGSGSVASAQVGADIPVSLSWTVGNPEDCPACKRQLVVGVGAEPGFCVDLGVPDDCPAATPGADSGSLAAPAQDGTWPVFALAAAEQDCAAAKAVFAASLDKLSIGTLHVYDGCNPTSCKALGKECGPLSDACSFTLDCGGCPGADICSPQGQCYCSASDPFEPNNTPGTAYYLGAFTDHDGTSANTLIGALQNEEDWFYLGSSDVSWAYMEPYVHVELDTGKPFEVTVAYICTDFSLPDPTIVGDTVCDWVPGIDFGTVPDVGTDIWAFHCQSNGAPVTVKFGPKCGFVDDSGTMYVGVSASGPCSGYTINLNL